MHVGLGVNASFDKYHADITAGRTTSSPIKTIKVMSEDDVVSIANGAADNFVNDLWTYNVSGDYVDKDFDKNQLWDGTDIIIHDDGKAIGKNIPVHGERKIYIIQENGVTAKLYTEYGLLCDLTQNDVNPTYGSTNLNINNVLYTVTIDKLTKDEIQYTATPLGGNGGSIIKTIYPKNGIFTIDGTNYTIKDFSESSLMYFCSGIGYMALQLKTEGGTSTGGAFYHDNDFQVTTDANGKITKYELLRGTEYIEYKPNPPVGGSKYDTLDIPASYLDVTSSGTATYMLQQSLNRRGTNYGWEMKLAYFHELANNFMIGVDLTGTISSKNRKDVNIQRFNVNNTSNPDLKLTGSESGEIVTAKYNVETGLYETTAATGAKIVNGEDLTLSNVPTYKAANPGMQVTTDPIANTYIDVTDEAKGVTFEKGIFNPRLAFIAGKTMANWFAGVRLGVAYTTGKVKTTDMTQYKNVSISSPFIGLHVMKQMQNNMNMYFTVEWNIGNGHRTVDMHGIRSFKQSGYNISAGLTWRLKLGN